MKSESGRHLLDQQKLLEQARAAKKEEAVQEILGIIDWAQRIGGVPGVEDLTCEHLSSWYILEELWKLRDRLCELIAERELELQEGPDTTAVPA